MATIASKRKRLLNQSAAARFIGISRETLRDWANKNIGPQSLRIGKRRYFSREILTQWIRSRSAI